MRLRMTMAGIALAAAGTAVAVLPTSTAIAAQLAPHTAAATQPRTVHDDCAAPGVSAHKIWSPPTSTHKGLWRLEAQAGIQCTARPEAIHMVAHLQQWVKRPEPGYFYIARSRIGSHLDKDLFLDRFAIHRCITGRFRAVVSLWGKSSTGVEYPVHYWCSKPQLRVGNCTTPPGVPRHRRHLRVGLHPLHVEACEPGPDPVHA